MAWVLNWFWIVIDFIWPKVRVFAARNPFKGDIYIGRVLALAHSLLHKNCFHAMSGKKLFSLCLNSFSNTSSLLKFAAGTNSALLPPVSRVWEAFCRLLWQRTGVPLGLLQNWAAFENPFLVVSRLFPAKEKTLFSFYQHLLFFLFLNNCFSK